MRFFNTFFRAIRPLMRGIDVQIDRESQTVTFEKNGQVEILTVDQLFDEIENMFAGRAAPAVRPDLAVRTDRQNGPGSPQDAPRLESNLGAWLTTCDHPIADPFKKTDQALTEPTRPLAACQVEVPT